MVYKMSHKKQDYIFCVGRAYLNVEYAYVPAGLCMHVCGHLCRGQELAMSFSLSTLHLFFETGSLIGCGAQLLG